MKLPFGSVCLESTDIGYLQISVLPVYLKNFYSELLRNFKEFEGEVATVDSYKIAYVKKEVQKQSGYFMQEAEWSHHNHKPSFEEQVGLSSMSITVPMLCVGFMAAMGDGVTKETLGWVATYPQVIMATAKIACFMNDITSYERGKDKGDAMSSVECYMNENRVTKEVAFTKIESMIEQEWKTTNQARFQEDHSRLPVVQRVINFAISMPFFYDKRNDLFTNNIALCSTIQSLFVTPIPVD